MIVKKAYDKPLCNKNRLSNRNREFVMIDSTYIRKESFRSGMKVVYEFPSATDDENKIEQEVKDILKHTLQEQLKKIS